MKSSQMKVRNLPGLVAPFTGAWIEMLLECRKRFWRMRVAPFTGAWIEIRRNRQRKEP